MCNGILVCGSMLVRGNDQMHDADSSPSRSPQAEGRPVAIDSRVAIDPNATSPDAPRPNAIGPDAPRPGAPRPNALQARARLKWWQDTVVYEVYPKSFLDTAGNGTGTLAGVTAKLDYLASLGVGAIWLTPVYRSPMGDNGYDVSDYYDIDSSFGTMADMDELIAQAARRDIRIVMDLVMNHTSNRNAWFVESASSRDNPKADWYVWVDPAPDGGAPTNWRGIFGGSAWTWCDTRGQYYLHTFAEFQPDLNWECAQMRAELFRMARFWLDKGVGGFRIDAVTYIKKPVLADAPTDGPDGLADIHAATANTSGILDFLREFKQEVMDGTDAFAVAEANGVEACELPLWVGDKGVFDMLFEFSHVDVPMGEGGTWHESGNWKLSDLKAALTASQEATKVNGWYPIYFENHDQARSVSQFLPRTSGTGVYASTRDATPAAAVASTRDATPAAATGARDAAGPLDPAGLRAAAKMLGCVLMTLRGTPFLYQGEELGYANVAWPSIEDYDDVSSHNQYAMALAAGCDEREALACVHAHSRDNARTPMQWDASRNAGFTCGEPWLPVHDDYAACNVEAQSADQDSVLTWYRKLAELRSELPVLVAGDYQELMARSEEVYAYERSCGEDRAVVLANFTDVVATFDETLVEGLDVAICTHGGPVRGVLRPYEAVVYANGTDGSRGGRG